MAVEIKVPSVGESITEGTIARWFKKDGDHVSVDEPLFELETEKASTEVPATTSGVLTIRVQEGRTVEVGTVVAFIDESGDGESDATRSAEKTPANKTPADREAGKDTARKKEDGKMVAAETSSTRAEAVKQDSEARESRSDSSDENVQLSPAARRLAAEEEVDPSRVEATGKGGVILKEDVQRFLEQRENQASPASEKPKPERAPETPATRSDSSAQAPSHAVSNTETRTRMSALRARIAERLLASQQSTASLTTFNEIDMSAVLDWRGRFKERFKATHGVGLGFMSFFVRAAIEALKAFPNVNARIDGSDIIQHHYQNIGVAVSTEKGLMVPVLHHAEHMSFAEIEKTIADLAERARVGKIGVPDLQGGTFTITNGGVFGSLLSTPILNPPQSAILGMHSIQKRPIAVDDQVVIRPMMYVALTYDHRLIDGREAVQFLVRIKECIENPERLLLAI